MSEKTIKFREAVRLAKEAAAAHTRHQDLVAFYGNDVLNEYSEECWPILEKAQHHVANIVDGLRRSQ